MAFGEIHTLWACSSFVKLGQFPLCREAVRLRERISPVSLQSMAHVGCPQIRHRLVINVSQRIVSNRLPITHSSYCHVLKNVHQLPTTYGKMWPHSPLGWSPSHLSCLLFFCSFKWRCAKKSNFLILNLCKYYFFYLYIQWLVKSTGWLSELSHLTNAFPYTYKEFLVFLYFDKKFFFFFFGRWGFNSILLFIYFYFFRLKSIFYFKRSVLFFLLE